MPFIHISFVCQHVAVEFDREMRTATLTVSAPDGTQPADLAGILALGAAWWPLDNFKVSPPEMDREATVAVHCKSGYRSMIAGSLLRRAGFKNVINVVGGFDAWRDAKLPVVSEKPVGA